MKEYGKEQKKRKQLCTLYVADIHILESDSEGGRKEGGREGGREEGRNNIEGSGRKGLLIGKDDESGRSL